ncbi:Bax inhibitor-1/YccA family protein [uncultured Helicobacter sp.]|uniref:Bax inhibitor-1/YccA family protein n=1 Tax=Helicobacter sp. TaxID=218 RepID=UPI00262DBA2D|nr:Bax inhibitor-1/YccA family protein [uncultured Helicobacter sp.]
MGLYDRNYQTQNQNIGLAQGAFANDNALVGFVKTTYKFFAASLLFATIGAIVGFMNFALVTDPAVRIGLIVAEIVAFLGLLFLRKSPGLNVALLFIFTFLTGITLVPLLGLVLARQGVGAIAQAFGMSTIVFGVMSIFALKTKADLANMGKMLLISLIVVVICSLVNLFLGSPMFQVLIAGAAVVLFSLFVAYDTQNIVRGLYADPVQAAVSLYLDFLNIFVSLLQLFGILGGKDE